MSSKAADGPIDHVKRWCVGEVTITRISELHALILDPEWLLKIGSEKRPDRGGGFRHPQRLT